MIAESLPSLLREWVARQARLMGLPGPDDYVVVLLRLEKQRQALDAVAKLTLPAGPSVAVRVGPSVNQSATDGPGCGGPAAGQPRVARACRR
jgi:hypothetical protein